MGDMMKFPATVEEFMEEHKMVDTEQIYSNGTEFVPIFRMKQWFEHEAAKKKDEKGKWRLVHRTLTADYIQCNKCEAVVKVDFLSDFHIPRVGYHYCPSCGKRMDGGADDGKSD